MHVRSEKGNEEDFRILKDRLPHRLLCQVDARSSLHVNRSTIFHGDKRSRPEISGQGPPLSRTSAEYSQSQTTKEKDTRARLHFMFSSLLHRGVRRCHLEKKLNYPGLGLPSNLAKSPEQQQKRGGKQRLEEDTSLIQNEIGYTRQKQRAPSVCVEPSGSEGGNWSHGSRGHQKETKDALGPCPSKPRRDSVSTRLAEGTLVVQNVDGPCSGVCFWKFEATPRSFG